MKIAPRLPTSGLWIAATVLQFPLASVIIPSMAVAEEAEESSKEIIAVQIRRQGYTCDNPESARPDPEYSRSDEEAWILKCQNATYRVRLVPDMAAKVERIE